MRRFCICLRYAIYAVAFTLFSFAVIPTQAQTEAGTTPPNSTLPAASTDNTGLHRASSACEARDYKPDGTVTNSEHFHRFASYVFSWQTIAGPAVATSLSQWLTSHKGYGSDPDAWGYHFGINLAGNVTGKFFSRYAGPAIFHQDDAYQPLGSGHSTSARLGHVLSHLLITDSADHTHHVFNVSAIPSSAINTASENLYEPHALRTASDNLAGFGEGLAVFVARDAYAEYHCAIRKLLPGHHHDDAFAPTNQ
jgi:hypothetical protein